MSITISCSQCPTPSHYRIGEDRVFVCEKCDHEITIDDLILEPGEYWTTDLRGRLVVESS